MARKATGRVVPYDRRDGRAFALRFTAFGERRYVTLGGESEGWTYAKAEAELQNVMADVRRGIWRPEPEPAPEPERDPTFHEFASEWYEASKPQWGEATRLDYQWQLSNHLLPFFARHRLSQITVREVDRYTAAKLREGKLSATSINKTITRLAQVLDVAEEYGLVERNPAKGKRRRVKASKPRRTYLDSAEQVTALLAAARRLDREARRERLPQREIILGTLVFTGVRIGECLALRWRDVDLAHGRLRVGRSKTEAGVRHLDLLPVLREALSVHRARCQSVGRSTRPDDLVFATAGIKPYSPSNVRTRYLARALTLANEGREVPLPKLTPHSLRRTFISLLVANGEDTAYVMGQVGHADPKVTMGVYAQVMSRRDGERERLRALVEAADWAVEMAVNGSGGRSEPSDAESPEPRLRSTMQVEGA